MHVLTVMKESVGEDGCFGAVDSRRAQQKDMYANNVKCFGSKQYLNTNVNFKV